MSTASEDAPNPTPAPERRKPKIFPWIAAVIVIGGAIYGYRTWTFNAVHVSTDDAQISSTVVQVVPQVAGNIVAIHVSENQPVKAGDLIAELDPASYVAAVQQAKANLALAVAQAKQANVNVDLTGQVGQAQIAQAQGQLSQTESAIGTSQADVARAEAGVASARAQASGAQANAVAAVAGVKTAQANLKRAQQGVTQAAALEENARAAVKTANANLNAAQATQGRAERDAERAQALLREGVISAQAADQATTAASVARSQVDAVQEQLRSAQALVAQRQAEVATARSQVEAAQAQVAQANAQVTASRDQSAAADQGIRQAIAQAQGARSSVEQARARTAAANGSLQQANTAPVQVQISRVGQEQAQARVAQAQAALDDAELHLRRTKIFAAVTGRISRKTMTVGQQVQPGTALCSIVPDGDRTVLANFKETQLAHVREGQPADVEVDGIPGVTFHARVESLSAGTGATFALLPPDNATGNFTKVVQRVPVKLVFEPNQPHFEELRAGMSVTVTIDTHGQEQS